MTTTYCTTKQVQKLLRTYKKIPAINSGDAEEVGTGDNSNAYFYLDQTGVIDSTYTLYYAASWSESATALTETTHYTLDKDEGAIVLTATGITVVGTNKIFAKYWYSEIEDSLIVESINRAEDWIDDKTNHAWRSKTVTEEYQDLPKNYVRYEWNTGFPVRLNHRSIRLNGSNQLDTTEGDKLEIWDGATWVDWTATYTDGRAGDFWVEPNIGKLWILSRSYYPRYASVRLTYRYGESTVPGDIEGATIKMAAIDLLTSDDRSVFVPEGSSQLSYDRKLELWNRDVDKVISNRAEFVFAR